jgi:hypothetical protein
LLPSGPRARPSSCDACCIRARPATACRASAGHRPRARRRSGGRSGARIVFVVAVPARGTLEACPLAGP